MEKSKSKRRAGKPPLSVTGPLEMPGEILPWERDLLDVLFEAIRGSETGDQESKPEEVAS